MPYLKLAETLGRFAMEWMHELLPDLRMVAVSLTNALTQRAALPISYLAAFPDTFPADAAVAVAAAAAAAAAAATAVALSPAAVAAAASTAAASALGPGAAGVSTCAAQICSDSQTLTGAEMCNSWSRALTLPPIYYESNPNILPGHAVSISQH